MNQTDKSVGLGFRRAIIGGPLLIMASKVSNRLQRRRALPVARTELDIREMSARRTAQRWRPGLYDGLPDLKVSLRRATHMASTVQPGGTVYAGIDY